MIKRCRICEEVKPLEEYHTKKGSRDGKRHECKKCVEEYHRKRRNGPKRQEILDKKKKYSKEHPEVKRRSHLKVKYKLEVNDYEEMLISQGGGCAICGSNEVGNNQHKHLHVDHCHSTGKVRGILCSKCNAGLGQFLDNIDFLKNAAEYLSRNRNPVMHKIKKLYKDSNLPTSHHDSVGLDIPTYSVEDRGGIVVIHTGIAVQPAPGYYFELVPRSSIYKHGLMLHNSVGIIDPDYRGEIIGIFKKTTMYSGGILPGDRLLQLIVRKLEDNSFEEVEELTATSRGGSGFGSTGK